jgi:hypothetical protein
VFGSKKVQKSKSFALSFSLSIGSEQALSILQCKEEYWHYLIQHSINLVKTAVDINEAMMCRAMCNKKTRSAGILPSTLVEILCIVMSGVVPFSLLIMAILRIV